MIGVSEEFLKCRETHASGGHVATEGVTKPMSIGVLNAAGGSFISEYATKPFKRHAHAAPRSLLHKENSIVFVPHRALGLDIFFDDSPYLLGKRNHTFLVPLAANFELAGKAVNVGYVESKDLGTAKATDEHQCDDGAVAIGFKCFKKRVDLVGFKGLYQPVGHANSKGSARFGVNRKNTKLSVQSKISFVSEPGGVIDPAVSAWNKFIEAVPVKNVDGVQAPVDRRRSCVAALLLVNEFDQDFEVDTRERRNFTLLPSEKSKKYHEVKGVGTNRSAVEAFSEIKFKEILNVSAESWRKPLHFVERRSVETGHKNGVDHFWLLSRSKTSCWHSLRRIVA